MYLAVGFVCQVGTAGLVWLSRQAEAEVAADVCRTMAMMCATVGVTFFILAAIEPARKWLEAQE